jgi:hypothetical protein
LRAQEGRQRIIGGEPRRFGNRAVSARHILHGSGRTGPLAPDFGLGWTGHRFQAAAAAPVRPAI